MNVSNCIMVCDSAEHAGGISSVILAQARGLRAAGMNVFVFAAFGPIDSALCASANQVVCMQAEQSKRNHLTEIWNPSAVRGLALFLEPFSTTDTVVHIHSISMGLSPSIARALRAKGIAYIITAHDASWACPTGYFYNMQTAQFCLLEPLSLACLCSHCDKRSYVHKAYKICKTAVLDYGSNLKRDAAAIIVPSELLQQRLRSRVPSTTPVITLLNPVLAEDRGVRVGAGDAFLFVGRLWEEKGIVELLQAVGDRFPLVVVGDGPLQGSLAKRYTNVDFKGWLSPAGVEVEMRKAIALVLPSLCLESFGLVVTEALSQGIPVIVSDRAGASTMVQQGQNGYVVDMGVPQQLLDACALLMDAPHAAVLSLNAYTAYWENPLTTRNYIKGLLGIFSTIAPYSRKSVI
jgi:glycosyltransferase involved in cell wall biosynthesis